MLFLLADPQPLTRRGLRSAISEAMAFTVVSDVADKCALVGALEECGGKAVVVLDFQLFDIASIDDLLVLQGRFPAAYWLLVANDPPITFLRRMAAEDRTALLLKDDPDDDIRQALCAATYGRRYTSENIALRIAETEAEEAERPQLTKAETEVLRLLAEGLSVKEIAAKRFSSAHTIVTHKKNIFRKLGVSTAYEATRYAMRAGLVEMAEYYI